MFDKLKNALHADPPQREDDVADDEQLAQSRDTGGADTQHGDAAATTGTGASGEFVGRVAGQDESAEGLTGAETRAFGRDDEPSH